MVFSSAVFLFIFLPVVLFLNFLLKPDYRNFFLLIVSLLFYAWGEGIIVVLMIFSSCINYIAGLGINYFRNRPLATKLVLGISIAVNLIFLFYYKYLNFFLESVPFLHSSKFVDTSIVLPIGISFYTFHGISYLVDIHRKNIPALKNPFDLGLYIAFFPQLIAGPIVRYSDIAEQLKKRQVTVELLFEGGIRFIRGLAKKILIANTMGAFVDTTFQVPIAELPTSISWLGIVCYALQIYFDFSGYSDMAIGLAKMFGFHFRENFEHPYTARSIQDFWRRWHISLSTWFRDYVYIPLGGNQKGVTRTYVNLIIVFLVTGLWHGAGWNFVIWGLFHGLFLILERSKVINLEKFPIFLRHIYTLSIVLIAWVFFRCETFSDAIAYLKALSGITNGNNIKPVLLLTPYFILILLIGIILSMPVRNTVYSWWSLEGRPSHVHLVLISVGYLFLLLISLTELAQSSYNPFIYFRF